jgi:hypothetical protein
MDETGLEWDLLVGYCEHHNEPSVSIKGMEFLDKLRECQLIKDYACNPHHSSSCKAQLVCYVNHSIIFNC